MIESLTDEQIQKMPLYVEKWIRIGLNTEPLDYDKAKECAKVIYKNANLEPPKFFFRAQSPISAAYMEVILAAIADTNFSEPLPKPSNKLLGKDFMKFAEISWKFLLPQIPTNMLPNKIDKTKVWAYIKSKIAPNIQNKLNEALNSQIYGFNESHWLAFYDYIYQEIGIEGLDIKKGDNILSGLMAMAQYCGWWSPYQELAILQDRPCEIHFNDSKLLHKDGGPSILYLDGFDSYSLNGVLVPEWLAVTPAGKIDPAKIKDITNVEQRREFVRKVGLERIKHTLKGQTIDTQTVTLATPDNPNWPCIYSLIELDFGKNVKRRVLEMPNASLPEIIHVEYVPVTCKSVNEAINFRLNREEEDIDKDGMDWYLHGDVIIKPKYKFKHTTTCPHNLKNLSLKKPCDEITKAQFDPDLDACPECSGLPSIQKFKRWPKIIA